MCEFAMNIMAKIPEICNKLNIDIKPVEADEVIDRTLSSTSIAACEIPSIREQIEEMKELHHKQICRLERLVREHELKLQDLEHAHKERLEEIEKERERRIEQYKKQFKTI